MRKNFAEYLAAATLAAAPLAAQEPTDIFGKLDANKDGYVTPDEVQDGQKALYERLLRTSDKDGDKKLSKDEFQAGLKPDEGPRPPLAGGQGPGPRGGKTDPRELFNRWDANKDGKLTKEELPEGAERFSRLDANADGSVTPEEFAEFGRLFAPRPGGAPNQISPNELEALFDRTDSNSDGKLTKSEIPEERQGMRAILERSGGESLTKAQFVRGMLAMAQPGGGQPPRPEGTPPRPEGPRPEGAPPRRPDGPPGGPAGGLLGALDTDRNGELSNAEIVAAGTSLLKLDRNNDGKLTPDEVFAGGPPGGMPGRPGGGPPGGPPNGNRPGQRGFGGQNPEELMQRLKAADANNDGKLSKDEAPDFIKDRFDRIDNNSDGVIDEAELRQMVRFMSQGGPNGKGKARPDNN